MMMMMNTKEEEEEVEDEFIPVCWSDLPFDLVAQLASKVLSFSLSDYIRFGAVYSPWRYFLLQDFEHIKLHNKLPVLLIPSFDDHNNYQKEGEGEGEEEEEEEEEEEAAALAAAVEEKKKREEGMVDLHNYYNPMDIWLGLNHKQRHQNTRSVYSISEKKVYDFQLPVPSYLNCRGSSHGWLVVVEECIDGTYPVHLLNPFRSDNNKIHLPPLTSNDPDEEVYHSYFLDKVILSANPSSTTTADDELVVLGLCGSAHLRFCRPGDRSWTLLPESFYKAWTPSAILNLICYRGQFWIILQNGRAVAFDISPLLPEPNVTTIIDPPLNDHPWPDIRYLVESAGNLFQVRRDIYMRDNADDDEGYSTVGFYVFKLDWASMEWVKTNSLDGHMFFLGDNASISLSASDYYFSGGGGSCKPNSIYFTDDYCAGYGSRPGCDGPHDMGVFNLDDGSLERFEPYYTVDSRHIMPAPIWIQPML